MFWIRRIPQPLRYIFAGGTSLLFALLLLTFFVEVLHIWYLSASFITFLIATFVSFWMQKTVTFTNQETGRRIMSPQLVAFYALSAINAGVNALLLYFFVEYIGLFYVVAQVCASATIALYSFFVYRYLFKTVTPATVE